MEGLGTESEHLQEAAHLRSDPGGYLRPQGASLMSKNASIAPQVNPDRNLRTLAGSAPHLDLPTQTFDPLAHRRETHAGPHRGGIEPSAVVNNLCQHVLVLRSQPYLDAPCSGMAPSVGEGLLQYAQHVYTFFSRERPTGNPSSTTNRISRSSVAWRLRSTNDSTDSKNGRSFSRLRSYMALRRPELARPRAPSSSSKSRLISDFLACRWVSRND